MGEREVIKSLCQSPPSLWQESSRESGHGDEHYVDRWTALSVCARVREGEMDVSGKYLASHFSLENGAWLSKETYSHTP